MILLFTLSGCIAGFQSRTVISAKEGVVTQYRPCAYFVICPPWDTPDSKPLKADVNKKEIQH